MFETFIVSSTTHLGTVGMNDLEGPLYYGPASPCILRSPSFYSMKKHVRFWPHRKAIGAVVDASDQLVSVREDGVLGSVKIDEGPCNTSEGCTTPEREEGQVWDFVAQIAIHVLTCVEEGLRKEMDSLLRIIRSEEFFTDTFR